MLSQPLCFLVCSGCVWDNEGQRDLMYCYYTVGSTSAVVFFPLLFGFKRKIESWLEVPVESYVSEYYLNLEA